MSRGLSTILLIVIILAVGIIAAIGGYYYGVKVATSTTTTTTSKITTTAVGATTTVIDMVDWKTYTNVGYSYSIKYPKDWKINSSNSKILTLGSPETAKQVEEQTKKTNGLNYGPLKNEDIVIYYYDTIADADHGDPKTAKTLDDLLNNKSFYKQFNKITFAGQDAYETIEYGEDTYYSIIIERDGHIYRIFFNNIPSKNQLSDIGNQILSTFRFDSK